MAGVIRKLKECRFCDLKMFVYGGLAAAMLIYAVIAADMTYIQHSSMPNACIEEVITALCFCALFAYLTVKRVLKLRKK